MYTSFDIYDNIPDEMKAYLQNYGFNFSEKMCKWAVSMMQTENGKITPISRDEVITLLNKYGITLKKDNGYNSTYVANMCKADYLNESVPNEQYMALFIKNYIDDPDYPSTEKAFRHFFADMMGMGKVINWKDML